MSATANADIEIARHKFARLRNFAPFWRNTNIFRSPQIATSSVMCLLSEEQLFSATRSQILISRGLGRTTSCRPLVHSTAIPELGIVGNPGQFVGVPRPAPRPAESHPAFGSAARFCHPWKLFLRSVVVGFCRKKRKGEKKKKGGVEVKIN